MKNVQFKQWECALSWGFYGNGRRALQLVAAHDVPEEELYAGEPIATATVNVVEAHLEADETCIKDYAENEGMLAVLVAAGIVAPAHRMVASGYVQIPVCRWLVTPNLVQE